MNAPLLEPVASAPKASSGRGPGLEVTAVPASDWIDPEGGDWACRHLPRYGHRFTAGERRATGLRSRLLVRIAGGVAVGAGSRRLVVGERGVRPTLCG